MNKLTVSSIALCAAFLLPTNASADALTALRQVDDVTLSRYFGASRPSYLTEKEKLEVSQALEKNALQSVRKPKRQHSSKSEEIARLNKIIEQLKADTENLKRELAKAGGTIVVDPEAEAKALVKVETFKTDLTQILQKPATLIDRVAFKSLLEELEKAGSAKGLLDLEQELLRQMVTPGVDSSRLEGINDILEKSEVLKKIREQREKERVLLLVDSGKQPKQEVIAQVNADATYFKTSPLSVLVTIDKGNFSFPAIQNNIGKVGKIVAKTPKRDLKAIYSHMHGLGFRADTMPATNISNFMSSLEPLMADAAPDKPGLTQREFDNLMKNTDRAVLGEIVNNMSDKGLSAAIKPLMNVGAAPVIALDPDPQALVIFNALKALAPSALSPLILDDNQSKIAANAVITKLATTPAATKHEQATAALDALKASGLALTFPDEGKIRGKIVSVATGVAGVPPMPAPPRGGAPVPPRGGAPVPPRGGAVAPRGAPVGGIVGVDAGLGNNIVLADAKPASLNKFKADVEATTLAHAAGIQGVVNANTNRALDVQNALVALMTAGGAAARMIPDNEALNAAYAVYTAPPGTSNKLLRDRASKMLTLDVPKSIAVNNALKAIFP